MVEAKKVNRAITGLVRCGVLLSAVMLGGCGSVGDAVNPVNWYRGVRDWVSGAPDRPEPADQVKTVGKDYPKIANDKRPETPSGKDRADLAKGLAADRSNAQYTQETLRREGNPTRPLSAESSIAKPVPPPPPETSRPAPAASPPPQPPAPAQPQSRAAEPPAPTRLSQGMGSAASPSPVVQQQAAVPPPPPAPPPQPQPAPVVQQQASVPPPPPPPPPPPASVAQQQAAMPPPPPVVTAPAPPASVDEIYRRRLAEFNGPVASAAAPAAMPAMATSPARMAVNAIATSSDRGAVVLTPPWEMKKSRFKPLDAFDASRSAASFQVGAVAFGEGTVAISSAMVASLKEIAGLAREKHGVLRIIGHSDSSRLDVDPLANRDANRLLALRRADTVGEQLLRLGVPAGRIYTGTAAEQGVSLAGGGSGGNDLTEIYIDY